MLDQNDNQKLDSSIFQTPRDDLLVDNSASIKSNATLTRELAYLKELAISIYHRILEKRKALEF